MARTNLFFNAAVRRFLTGIALVAALTAEGSVAASHIVTVRPLDPVDRADLVTMLVQALGRNPDADVYRNCYSDVRKQRYADEVCYAKSKKWLTHFGGPRFYPNTRVTAAEAYHTVLRAFGLRIPHDGPDFGAPISREEIAALIENHSPVATLPLYSASVTAATTAVQRAPPPGYPRP